MDSQTAKGIPDMHLIDIGVLSVGGILSVVLDVDKPLLTDFINAHISTVVFREFLLFLRNQSDF